MSNVAAQTNTPLLEESTISNLMQDQQVLTSARDRPLTQNKKNIVVLMDSSPAIEGPF